MFKKVQKKQKIDIEESINVIAENLGDSSN